MSAPQQVVYANAPVQQVAAPSVTFSEKPLDCCMYTTLAMSVITLIGGIIVIAIGAGVTSHYDSIIACGFLILIGASLGIPAVFCKNKWGMIGFVVLIVLLATIAGIIAGFATVVGGVSSLVCNDYLDNPSQYYVCSASAASCNKERAYGASSTNAPVCTSQHGGDLTCCQGVAAHWAQDSKNQGCIQDDKKTECDESGPAATGGIMVIVFSVIGCLTGCVACCTCCMNGAFFDGNGQEMNVTVAAVATPPTEVVAANNVAAPGMEKTEVVGATVTAPQTELVEVPKTTDGPTGPPQYAAPPPPAAQRSCC
jgi:hypothetical protein